MTQRALLGILVAASLSMVAGCGGTKWIVPEPSNITLEAAMESVGKGLKQMKDAQGNIKTGLLPSEVTVTFNVTASATDTKSLHIAVSTPQAPQVPVSGSITSDLSTAITANRGNSITIKFTNLLYTPTGQLLTDKSADEIRNKLKTLAGEGIVIYFTPEEIKKSLGNIEDKGIINYFQNP